MEGATASDPEASQATRSWWWGVGRLNSSVAGSYKSSSPGPSSEEQGNLWKSITKSVVK